MDTDKKAIGISRKGENLMSEGNVVIGFTTDNYLMLDADLKKEEDIEWAKEYGKDFHLGSALIMKTSDSFQLDLYGNKLYNFCIVFGQPLPWQEIILHVENAFKEGIVNKGFRDMRYLGHITERVNRKNRRKSHPKVFKYIPSKDKNNEGCMEYLRWWKWNKKVGESCPR
jgi:hypothetical protein